MSGILIVLPVYNGIRFLREQLDSILNQEIKHFRIICRDDGSSDGSADLLAEYALRFPEKFSVLSEPPGNLGVSASFSLLLAEALEQGDSDTYVALADQDDIWYPHKLKRLLTEMQRLDTAPGFPVLVHSDLRVIAEDGRILEPSLVQFQGLRPRAQRFAARLLGNAVTGCSVLVNRSLLEQALPVPPAAVMHDWWLVLVASSFGRVVYVDEPLLGYRQHDANTLGAQPRRDLSANGFVTRIAGNADAEFYDDVLGQAAVFEERFGDRLGRSQRLLLRASRALRWKSAPWQRLAYHLLRRL